MFLSGWRSYGSRACVIILFSSFKSTKINLPSGSKNCFLISLILKVAVKQNACPCAWARGAAKNSCEAPFWWLQSFFFFGAVNVLKKKYSFFFFFYSKPIQRKVSRLLRLVGKPLTLKEKVINSSIANLLMINGIGKGNAETKCKL